MRRRFTDGVLTDVPKLLLTAIVLLGCAVASAADLTPHEAKYRVKISILGGDLNTRLVASDSGYAANHVIRPTGLSKLAASGKIDETSEFGISNDRVVPVDYRSVDELTRDKTSADVVFDWENERLDGSINGQPADFDIEDGMLDRVSIQYQLMRDLKRGELREQYLLFDIDEVKVLNVSNAGEREVKTPAGRFNVVGIRHQAEGSSRTTTLWCAEELDFLPVIIEQHRKGKLRLRAKLENYTALNARTDQSR
ncbi:MAG: DUF3108 domain-containing protein [Woeseiaceae bacterium]|nr:DUF3108 domain-containing protein [Woeseiaceae bacterium]